MTAEKIFLLLLGIFIAGVFTAGSLAGLIMYMSNNSDLEPANPIEWREQRRDSEDDQQ